MLSAGGDGGLRGYDVASLLGRWRAIGRVEWRHVFTHELDINFLHSLYLRGIGGALFAEAGVVSPCESYAPDAKSVNADVGYTLRIFGDWFGVSQTTINIDFAVPLVQHDRELLRHARVRGEQGAVRLLLQLRPALVTAAATGRAG